MTHSTGSRSISRVSALVRALGCTALALTGLVAGVCNAQQVNPQFPQPLVYATGGQVTDVVSGQFQNPPAPGPDILYLNAATTTGGVATVTGGLLLNNQPGFANVTQNHFQFTSATKVVGAVGDFDQDGNSDFAFAITPQSLHVISFCVYYGTGTGPTSGTPAYSPLSAKSGCLSFPSQGANLPDLEYIASYKYEAGQPPWLLIEDSANSYLYIVANNGHPSLNGGGLISFGSSGPGIALASLPDGAGPIAVADLNGDGVADIVLNGQKGNSASVYLSQGTSLNFSSPTTYHFDHNVHSLLLQDMDGDSHPDMVVEGDNGIIEIHKGNADGSFVNTSEGGTPTGVDGFSGNGGQLAAIDPNTHDIYTATPIGLSRLAPVVPGSLTYSLQSIYNIGPGRSSYALADFYNTNVMDLAVNSPEGVAIVVGDSTGGFLTSQAYAALKPALSSAIGKFRNSTADPSGALDVVVSTGAAQGQLLTGNGNGTFNTFSGATNTSSGPAAIPANLWSNVVAGDFNGDGISDIAYSLTGLPVLTSGAGLYVQYGNGDGTFAAPVPVNGAESGNTLFGENAVADFNGDSKDDIANADANYTDTLLGQSGASPFTIGLNQSSRTSSFSPVAAGFFNANRLAKQDLVVGQGNSIIPYLNSGDGIHFTAEPALSGTPTGSTLVLAAVMLADLDHDGKGDVAAVYYSTAASSSNGQATTPAQLYIWYGNGDGTFSSQPQSLNLTRDDYLGAVADLNNDGYPDIVMADGSVVTVLYNQGGRSYVSDYGTQCNPCGELHFLAGEGINSLSVADVSGDGSPDLVVANGGATISNPIALGASTQSAVSLAQNPGVNTGGITVLRNSVATHAVAGTLTASPEPSVYQQPFNLIMTLTQTTSGVAQPTGSVEFYIDGTSAGFATVVPGATSSTATFNIPTGNSYTVGAHSIEAIYLGDAANSKLTLQATHQIVSSSISTTTYLLLCIGPTAACPSTGAINPPPPYQATLTMSYGQTWNGVTYIVANGGTSTPTGTLDLQQTFNGATTTLCTLTASSGGACPAAVGTTIGTEVGTHVFQSVYSGDATYQGSSSPTVTITVLQDTTTGTLSAAPNPSPEGKPVTLTATFTDNAAPPAGTVTFTYAGNTIGTATLTAGASGFSSTATLTTSTLPVGSDTVTAVYGGNTNFGAASASTTVTISPPLTGNFTLSVTPNPVNIGVGAFSQLAVTIASQNGFNQPVQLGCSGLPSEATCTFVDKTLTGSGSTVLYISTTAPHTCGTTTPYFVGSNGGWGLAPLGVPALAGIVVLFVPGRRRWLRSLMTIAVIAMGVHLTGCGNCTDLGTRPNTYTIQVTGSSTTTSEVETVPVTVNVVI